MIDLPPVPKLWLPPKPAIVRAYDKHDVEQHKRQHATIQMGIGFNGQPVIPPSIVLKDTGAGANSGSSSVALDCGTAVDDKDFLIIGVSRSGAGTMGATYGGKTLSLINSAQTGFSSLFICSPANTIGVSGTKNVVLAITGGSSGMFAAIWRVSHADPTPVDTKTANSSSISLAVSAVNQAAIAINGIFGNGTGGTLSTAWSASVTEVFDIHDAAQVNALSGAQSPLTSGATTLTIAATRTGGLGQGLVGALFQGLF